VTVQQTPLAVARAPASAEQGPTWERLEEQIGWYDRAARRNQLWFRGTKVVQLCLGAAVPVVATTAAPRWLLGALGAGVVVVEGAAQLFQFHRNWISYRATCEALRREQHLCRVHAGVYAGREDGMRLLAERLELIVGRETGQWAQAESSMAAAEGKTRGGSQAR
jgi:hypothetical protein